MCHLPEATGTLLFLHLHESSQDYLAPHSILVPPAHEVHNLRAFFFTDHVTIAAGAHTALIT